VRVLLRKLSLPGERPVGGNFSSRITREDGADHRIIRQGFSESFCSKS
jgi:hypothetical protein